ncbi:hypothetical protein VF21_10127 [Pseudogymnoascus sp. 05NY08]|nr:hypothetical protein VF21_10127 [Pseudogymnoascus sp. 05NY08]
MTDPVAATTTTPWTEEELRAKVGQLFIVGFEGHVPNEDVKTLIKTHKVGAIVLFQRNVESASQLLELTSSLQEIARSAGHDHGLLIAIDQENGLVTRIKPPIAAQLPGLMTLGATGDASSAFEIASATSEVLKSFGINMIYGPIADVNSEPKNPVIGVRSPSDDPEVVGRFVSAQIKAFKEGGIASCAKHFPGHGDTAVDSHVGLPVVSKNRAMLEACEFVPFRRAAVEGVDAIMTAHIAMPGISDDDASKALPASLNSDAIKILREDMKYKGVIVCDCLEMDGVRATYGTEKGAVLAIKAGTDSIMVCHTMSAQAGAIEHVVQAVKQGEISQETIQVSLNRVNELKRKYLPLSSTNLPVSIDVRATNKRHAALASRMYARSTTVVRSAPGRLPISKSLTTKSVYLFPGKTPLGGGLGGGAVESGEVKTRESYLKNAFLDLLETDNPLVHTIQYFDSRPLDQAEEDLIVQADVVVFSTRNANHSQYQKNLGLALGKKLGNKLIVVATCDPYDFLDDVETIKNYIAIYEPTPEAFKSAVDVIFGAIPASGVLPVGSVYAKHEVRSLNSTSEDEVTHVWNLWQEIFPTWPIERSHLALILTQSDRIHLIHDKGFSLAYYEKTDVGVDGMISIIGVLDSYRGKGLGTALVNKTREELQALSRAGEITSIGIKSSFPRLWPGVPISFPSKYRDFFLHRGFRKSQEPTARDLWKSITADIAPPAVLEQVAKLPLTFAPWSPELYEECMTKQRANFGDNKKWVEAYERLAKAKQHQEVLVAFDESGAQVAWTLMCTPNTVVGQDFVFLPRVPSKDKTGLIACVGVDGSARGKGVGLALLVKAMEYMKARGLEGVFIDWVVIRGFYETLGFKVFWEYEKYTW